jgi:hypothetical protein
VKAATDSGRNLIAGLGVEGHAVDLDVEREAEHHSDEDKDPERGHALQARVDGDGQDDVGGHQDLEPEEEGVSQPPPGLLEVGGAPFPPEDWEHERDHATDGDDRDADDLESLGDVLHQP